jgi:hypothetical protein
MHADDSVSMTMEPRDPESGIRSDAPALPVPVPVLAASEAAPGAEAAARPEEVQGLLSAIRRLDVVVTEETAALLTGKKVDFQDFSMRKSQSMLEFVRLMRAGAHLGGEAQVAGEMRELRQKLERNRAVLEMHYEAVREVAEIIVRAMREAESDGTYSSQVSSECR